MMSPLLKVTFILRANQSHSRSRISITSARLAQVESGHRSRSVPQILASPSKSRFPALNAATPSQNDISGAAAEPG